MKDISISSKCTVKNCLKQLDKAATGVLFVVDEDDHLIGAISDGDIRRALLKGIELDESITFVYNSSPCYLEEGFSLNEAKNLFLDKRINVIPVIDRNRNIIDFLDWKGIFGRVLVKKKKPLDVPVVIMAGGKGTRMTPFTTVLPKPLIPVGDKTILEVIISGFTEYEIRDFYFTLNYRGQVIEAYFNSIEKNYNVHNLWEKEFEGTAGSLKLLPKDKIESDFIVSNCDVIVKADYEDALEHHRKNNAYITALSSIQHYKIPYGVIEFKENGEIVSLTEKPEYTFSVNTGVYIVNKKALNFIPKEKVFHMTHLIEYLIKNDMQVVTYPVNDYIDIGQWDEYKKALERL